MIRIAVCCYKRERSPLIITQKVCTTKVMHTEKRKPRLLLHKLKIKSGYQYHNHFVEFALLPNSKMIMVKKGYSYPIKRKIPQF